MYPELFEIPFVHWTIKSYGLMMVIGFIAAILLIKRLSRDITTNSELITNAALYSLIAGIVGSRVFYVVHHFEYFRDDLLGIFAIWKGGLELLGGVILAIIVIFFYLRRHKLPVLQYLDILAIGLFLALAFGRIGCFLNGCCFGKPTNLPWAVRFPYGSDSYKSQISPDPARNRPKPYLELPDDFFGYIDEDGQYIPGLKPFNELTYEQKVMVTNNGPWRALPVHPTQLYSSVNAAVCSLLLYLFWRRSKKAQKQKQFEKLFTKPGLTFALMFILYGITRFFIEFVRDDNPYEFDSLTISQNICIAMLLLGVILMTIFQKFSPKRNT